MQTRLDEVHVSVKELESTSSLFVVLLVIPEGADEGNYKRSIFSSA